MLSKWACRLSVGMNHNAFDLPAQVDRGWQTHGDAWIRGLFPAERGWWRSHKLVGRIVEASEDSVVVALLSSEVPAGISQILTVPAASSQPSLTFLRIATSDFSSVTPAGWPAATHLPKQAICLAAWQGLEDPSLVSSEAEKPVAKVKGVSKTVQEDMARLRKTLTPDSDEDTEESSEDGEGDLPFPKTIGLLAPGAKGAITSKMGVEPKPKKKETDPSAALMTMMEQGLAQGQSPADLMPMMMMSFKLNQQTQQGRKGRKSSAKSSASTDHGGSSSESDSDSDAISGKGMKAVVTLHRLHRRIKRRPGSICKKFEKEITTELGIVPGQPWTLRQWLAKQPWGKFRGIYRCAIQDAIAYEYLRNGQHEVAAAQLAQNMKSKIQSVLQGGDWSAAWLLTGIADPLTKKEWGGTQEEMAVVSEYVNALAKLKKKVKEAKDASQAEEGD